MEQQVIGNVVGLEQRSGGWVAVAILVPGKEYPVKLSTKKTELIQQAQQMMGQVVTAGYNEQESTNINPHNGQPYTNRYLEALAFGQVDLVGAPTQIQPQQQMPQQQYQPQPVQQPQMQQQPQPWTGASPQEMAQPGPTPQAPFLPPPVVGTDQVREAKIHRQSAAKVAVQLLQFLTPEERNLASLVRISEQLCHYFDNGVQWTTPPVQTQATQPQAQQQQQMQEQPQQGYEQPDEYGDIPF